MKKLLSLFMMVVVFNSCTEEEVQTCDTNQICTLQFVSVKVKFIDANGIALAVNDFKALNLRTNKLLSTQNDGNPKGVYTVASDVDLKDLSTSDKVMVSATHPVTNVTKQQEYTISGGGCACHVSKLAGPDEIRF